MWAHVLLTYKKQNNVQRENCFMLMSTSKKDCLTWDFNFWLNLTVTD